MSGPTLVRLTLGLDSAPIMAQRLRADVGRGEPQSLQADPMRVEPGETITLRLYPGSSIILQEAGS